MTQPQGDWPDIDQAARLTEESTQRAERDRQQAHAAAKRTLSIARLLRQLREANGFGKLLDDAFGGGRG